MKTCDTCPASHDWHGRALQLFGPSALDCPSSQVWMQTEVNRFKLINTSGPAKRRRPRQIAEACFENCEDLLFVRRGMNADQGDAGLLNGFVQSRNVGIRNLFPCCELLLEVLMQSVVNIHLALRGSIV